MKGREELRLSASFCFAFGTFLLKIALAAGFSAEPELPRVFLDTTYVEPSGREIVVAAGGDFQAALDAAQPGDIITLEAGATFMGNFILRNKAGTGWIYIRSSAHASLPPPGTRVSLLHADLMPKIVSPNLLPAIRTEEAAHHYRFVGLEVTTTHATTASSYIRLVLLEAIGGQTSLSQVPSDIIFDRCYVHGTPTGNVRHGITVHGARISVIDSHLSDFHDVGADTQAIIGFNGPGPFKIVNNYLEASGENVMFGGGDPSIPDLVPSDIEIQHNHFFKPLSWKADDPSYAGINWVVKNLFELKNAQRVLVEGNILERNWFASQNGIAILFTVRNQDGGAPWAVVQDVTFTKNIIRDSNAGFDITGKDDNYPSQRAKRILIKDNLLENLDAFAYGSDSRCNKIFTLGNKVNPDPSVPGGILDLTIDHNTASISGICTAAVSLGDSTDDFDKHENFAFQNNLLRNSAPERAVFQSGISGSGVSEGTGALTTYTKPGSSVVKNVFICRPSFLYPPDNFFPAADADVGFVDPAGGDFRLAATSPFKGAGTDGKDIGADIEALEAATAGVIEGVTYDSSAPTIVPILSAEPNGIGWYNTAVTVSWSVSDHESGIASSIGCDAVTLESDTGGTALICSAMNRAGVSASESVTIRIDRTPPEAYSRFDPATRDVAVFGRDTLSGVPAGPVIPLSVVLGRADDREEDDEDDRDKDHDLWEFRTYQVMDLAGNSLLLRKKVKRNGQKVKARIVSLQYNNGPVLTPPRNRESFEEEVKRNGSLKDLEQKMEVGKRRAKQGVEAEFDAKKNQTMIKVEVPGSDTNIIKPGLVLLQMATDKGDLNIDF